MIVSARNVLIVGLNHSLSNDFLYHDMKHRAAIWVIHKNSLDYSVKVEEVKETRSLLPYDVTRIVSDISALREKAACLASGRDDRIVELCKVFLAFQLNQQIPDFDFRNAFYTCRGGREIVCFYDFVENEITCDLDDRIYNAVADLFKKPLLQMEQTQYQIIDYDWAVDFFKNLPHGDEIRKMVVVEPGGADALETEDTPTANGYDKAAPERRALFCRKCGARLLPDSLFCSYCGTKVVY